MANQVLVFDWIAGLSQDISLGEKEGARAEAKFRRRLTPGAFFYFSSDICLALSCLGKSVKLSFPIRLNMKMFKNNFITCVIILKYAHSLLE